MSIEYIQGSLVTNCSHSLLLEEQNGYRKLLFCIVFVFILKQLLGKWREFNFMLKRTHFENAFHKLDGRIHENT